MTHEKKFTPAGGKTNTRPMSYSFWDDGATKVTAPWNKNLQGSSKHNCKYNFYGIEQGSGSVGKGSSACNAIVVHMNEAGLVDDSGTPYVASSYYSGSDHCQLFFSKTDCGSVSTFSDDASHAQVMTAKASCKTKG